jgi:asparagine synthase (glutamine-hydrolysing)
MCGFVGIWQPPESAEGPLAAKVRRMTDTLIHRGPDDSGVWIDEAAGLALGFRRLAILDLSPLGHQPMRSASGRYVIVFNGEVYNFSSLRRELEPLGYGFRGNSDTEVILAAMEQWGIRAAVERFVGMFALAVWDCQCRRLTLVRDRLGIKPLYYGWNRGVFLCGSELKAFRAYPGFDPQVDRDALSLYLRHACIPAPHSIYRGIHKLPPGCLVEIASPLPAESAQPVAYWSTQAAASQGVANRFTGSPKEAIDALDDLLREAVKMRMVADVPLGAFLSGGIDSSMVVALMQAQSARPVRTFTMGFHELDHNEAEHAKTVAKHLGTDHTELYVSPDDARSVISRLPDMFDEPFADSSQIPTFLVSELTRRHVTVCLSGDGGDELFGGYHQYQTVPQRYRMGDWCPAAIRQRLGRMLYECGNRFPIECFGSSGKALKTRMRLEGRLLAAVGHRALHRAYASQIEDPLEVVIGGGDPLYVLTNAEQDVSLPDLAEQLMYYDMSCYLPDDILTKVDRASMAVSLEARVPILDHRVVEFAWRLPSQLKIQNGQGKWILRQVLYRYVPRELIERPKKGFAVPIAHWLRGPLRDWAADILNENTLSQDGFFQPKIVMSWWKRFLAGEPQLHARLWIILMFQTWKNRWLN